MLKTLFQITELDVPTEHVEDLQGGKLNLVKAVNDFCCNVEWITCLHMIRVFSLYFWLTSDKDLKVSLIINNKITNIIAPYYCRRKKLNQHLEMLSMARVLL